MASETAQSFDPFEQNITMHGADGTPFLVPVNSVDTWLQYCIRICINYGCQMGASAILLIVLILLTRAEKRSSVVFWLNSLALVSNVARLLCQLIYFTGPLVRLYPIFAEDYSRVPQSAYANSIIGAVFAFLAVVFMEVSLVLQVQVVCATLRRWYRRVLLATSVLVAMIPIGFRFALLVVNSMSIMDLEVISPTWLENSTNVVVTVSICFFCTVFVVKLGLAIKLRKQLGVQEYGPMKVIFVMGCQTMIIPAFFSILQYFVHVPELYSNVLTLVIISLPLSTIWAGSTFEQKSRVTSRTSDSHRHLMNVNSYNPMRNNNLSTSFSSDATTRNNIPANAMCYAALSPTRQVDPELSKYGISVEHDYSVQSHQKDGGECGDPVV
ncbi:alpha-factor pheromone receptor STE2 [Aspergillus ruber CBS 135680]|uniref:Mating-type alpha-pheromone receptor PreB n=1 Tax=Aspergillus ruber (strain CBS 135680) TaxID=1388766 RepID=A0A017S298_ASPRC|nr:uncharacterized protein EURHEDRAFT_534094 [Aspergillus ruber CBS 135680]EYE90769.1 hypothetical protein EURHEDRAFT_534094 [Aspergillus ruber CBS 135680]